MHNFSKTSVRPIRYDISSNTCLNAVAVISDYSNRKKKIGAYNVANRWRKRGIATTNMEYSITYYFNYPTYVAIYHTDGTVVVSHGGVECGQGVNTKVAQTVAYTLGIPYELVSVKASDNVISANSGVTGGSITSESICFVSVILTTI